MRLRQLPCRAALALVVTIDRVERGGGLVERGEAEHAFAVREIGARAGVLHDDRLAARQITERAVAHPGVLELHAGRLRAAELAARVLHVRAVGLRAPGDLPGVPRRARRCRAPARAAGGCAAAARRTRGTPLASCSPAAPSCRSR